MWDPDGNQGMKEKVNFTDKKYYIIKVQFLLPECAKTRLRSSVISKISRLYSGLPLKWKGKREEGQGGMSRLKEERAGKERKRKGNGGE
jgi:hypothetical protein